MAPESNTNSAVSGQDRPRWTHVLPTPVRSLGRPLLHKWQYFCDVSRGKLREKLAAPGVTSCLMGGCANQIFQYATGLALARRLGVDLKLDISAYEPENQAKTPRMYSLGLFKGVNAQVVRTPNGQIIREQGFSYQPALLEKAPRACSLVGYWQCEKYFFGLRDELRERLLPREPLPARMELGHARDRHEDPEHAVVAPAVAHRIEVRAHEERARGRVPGFVAPDDAPHGIHADRHPGLAHPLRDHARGRLVRGREIGAGVVVRRVAVAREHRGLIEDAAARGVAGGGSRFHGSAAV